MENSLLYIPEQMPFPNEKDAGYIETICIKIEELVIKTHGHTLILFTSYYLMEKIFYKVQMRIKDYPLFIMGKGRLSALSEFRYSGNGVLFASDSAGEGIDLVGDILSSVIIVKLPFPVPDAVARHEQEMYKDVHDYIKEVAEPSMLIKLRQWIGRGIRNEMDTAVFSILDSRTGKYGKYRQGVLAALPDMPVTDNIEDVGKFIKNKKEEVIFHDT